MIAKGHRDLDGTLGASVQATTHDISTMYCLAVCAASGL